MYKIQVTNRFDSELLIQHKEIKDQLILEMLINFSKEMQKNKCFDLSEISGLKNQQYMNADETEFILKGYVITPTEYKEIIHTLHFIKSALPEQMRGYANHLHSLLTGSESV